MQKSLGGSIVGLVRSLAEQMPNGAADVAGSIGVSVASVQRWLKGTARPQPTIEGKLRAVAERLASGAGYQPSLFAWPDQSRDELLRRALLKTCHQLRECLHRRGRLSSRHEALDELSKLLFAHVMSMSGGESGIDPRLIGTGVGAAKRLRTFVDKTIARYLPVSLSHEMKADEFRLRLRDSEDELAHEIAECFLPLELPDLVVHIQGRDSVDVLNDAFGQFIADSFVDEKELGQYLTPNEVVRFMVRLGIASLDERDRAAFTDVSLQERAGLILDPSCGVGTFLTEALRLLYSEVKAARGEQAATGWVVQAIRHNVVGVDKSERMLRLALTNLAMFGSREVNLHLANSLARTKRDGALMASFEKRAKLILTNPPFGASFPVSELTQYKIATKWARKPPRTVDSELLFIERYIDWLAPGGHLIAIVPDSVLTNRGLFQDVRHNILLDVDVRAVISLPAVTFGVAGTSTKTSILHLQKHSGTTGRRATFFGVCKDIGYDVQTRGSARTKIPTGRNQLEDLLPLAISGTEGHAARVVSLKPNESRWDATFHAGLPTAVSSRLAKSTSDTVRVCDVAVLSLDRVNPLRMGSTREFKYIEISDVDGFTCSVRAKQLECLAAPTRARKLVRAGDVLVSTVRPERRTVGVVPTELDGAVCSTGFAVLRSEIIPPLVLARLLQSDFVNAQFLRDNSGIAYPAIDEARIPEIVLPVTLASVMGLAPKAAELTQARQETERLSREFDEGISGVISNWVEA